MKSKSLKKLGIFSVFGMMLGVGLGADFETRELVAQNVRRGRSPAYLPSLTREADGVAPLEHATVAGLISAQLPD
jgi:hypothetical protein